MTKRYTEDDNPVARLLERARRVGLTRRRLAAELGVSERTLRYWAAGRGDIRIEAYRKLLETVRRAMQQTPEGRGQAEA